MSSPAACATCSPSVGRVSARAGSWSPELANHFKEEINLWKGVANPVIIDKLRVSMPKVDWSRLPNSATRLSAIAFLSNRPKQGTNAGLQV